MNPIANLTYLTYLINRGSATRLINLKIERIWKQL